MKKIARNIYIICSFIVSRLRGERYRPLVKKMGKGFKMGKGSVILNPFDVEIGDYCSIGRYTTMGDGGGLKMGSFAVIGPYCHIISSIHNYSDWSKPIRMQEVISKKTEIDDDVWIGSGSIVMAGVHIGRGAIVGSNSVVTKDIRPYAIAVGSPAEVIKYRFDQESIKKASKIRMEQFNPHYWRDFI